MNVSLEHQDTVKADFSGADIDRVISELERISTAQTWDSQANLDNTIGAILNLSRGDFQELRSLVDAARIDFRDVIYWWTLEQGKTSKK